MSARTFVAAEAGVNHNGDLGLAKARVGVAAEAGADAVKFQTFSVDRLLTRSAEPADYRAGFSSSMRLTNLRVYFAASRIGRST